MAFQLAPSSVLISTTPPSQAPWTFELERESMFECDRERTGADLQHRRHEALLVREGGLAVIVLAVVVGSEPHVLDRRQRTTLPRRDVGKRHRVARDRPAVIEQTPPFPWPRSQARRRN